MLPSDAARRPFASPGPALITAALILLGTAATARAEPHDGSWAVTFSVQQGTCSQRSIVLHVSSGSITHHGLGLMFHAAGQVSGNGNLKANLSALGHTASARGQRSADTGTWVLSEYNCSGQWTAKRTGA